MDGDLDEKDCSETTKIMHFFVKVFSEYFVYFGLEFGYLDVKILEAVKYFFLQ